MKNTLTEEDLGLAEVIDDLYNPDTVCAFCRRPVYYSAPDVVFLHVDGGYFCDRLESRSATPQQVYWDKLTALGTGEV